MSSERVQVSFGLTRLAKDVVTLWIHSIFWLQGEKDTLQLTAQFWPHESTTYQKQSPINQSINQSVNRIIDESINQTTKDHSTIPSILKAFLISTSSTDIKENKFKFISKVSGQKVLKVVHSRAFFRNSIHQPINQSSLQPHADLLAHDNDLLIKKAKAIPPSASWIKKPKVSVNAPGLQWISAGVSGTNVVLSSTSSTRKNCMMNRTDKQNSAVEKITGIVSRFPLKA